ncbi:hypothetical protein HJC23_001097 [Cyclotella cryptica]|uniref:Uncharacterized protein n=1 Tax=Cyclotella cryptica TaxID=29204 RepID=A0ABD3QJY8_9STRA|eukprot:CCRYP_005068-RA/>CCRYP_005068-RA protein AED:0.65 eAED:0.44 QI:0/-1/0/1/-1/1/1/0/229
MANVLPGEKGRVWVPTFFCWAFTMYCWFCVRREMDHYMELRMYILGGEEEARMFGKESLRRELAEGRGASGMLKLVSETPKEEPLENAVVENEDNQIESDYRLQIPDVRSLSTWSSSPLLPENEEDVSPPNLSYHSFGENCGVYRTVFVCKGWGNLARGEIVKSNVGGKVVEGVALIGRSQDFHCIFGGRDSRIKLETKFVGLVTSRMCPCCACFCWSFAEAVSSIFGL